MIKGRDQIICQLVQEKSKEELCEAFGRRLKELLKKQNMTQQMLAEKAGLTTMQVGSYARGKTQPTLKTLCKLSAILGVSVDYLIGTTNVNDTGIVVKQKAKEVIEENKSIALVTPELLNNNYGRGYYDGFNDGIIALLDALEIEHNFKKFG